jgi:ABC-type phosphate transport system substrate-binding protein
VYSYFVAFLMFFHAATPRPTTTGCVIVVNDANQFYTASPTQIADLFLEKRTTWDNGKNVLPVDLEPESPVREVFSVAILGRPLQAVQAYWRGKVYRQDAVPPPELASDQAVVDYVRKNPGAIGYVSADAALGDGVHAIVVMR